MKRQLAIYLWMNVPIPWGKCHKYNLNQWGSTSYNLR